MSTDHQIVHGEALQWLRSLPDACADAVITDPPYSSGGMFRGDRARAPSSKYEQGGQSLTRPDFFGDTMDQRVWVGWCEEWLRECRRALMDGGRLLAFIDWRQLPALTDAVQRSGMIWRGVITWDKGLGSRAPHTGYHRHQCEYAVFATSGKCPPADGRGPFPGCYRYPVLQSDKHHMAGKPTPLLRDFVKTVPPGGLILDPFAGSGTTVVAAALEGRRAWGCELSREYCSVAQQRIAEVVDMRGAAEQAGLFEAAS